MGITKGLLTSNTDLWETPKDFFYKMDKEFNFTLDVCAIPENAKCKNYFTPSMDGLIQEWVGSCWMNPPYGKEIGLWMKKAYESFLNKSVTSVVCLIPARTDSKWWHDYAMKGEIRFIKGRLKFGDSKNPAPFPSAIVIFSPNMKTNSIISIESI